jgi:Flp pilus assembly protein TadD
LGQVCAQQGDKLAARAAFRKALELNPELKPARAALDALH